MLLAAAGTANRVIAERLDICEDTARKWRRRYCEQGIEALADAPRPGRPRVFPARIVAGVKALACEMPAASGTPLARWTCPELARHAAASGIAPAPSASTVRRWLADDALKPWQHRSWIFPRDPHFVLKASRVLDLCQREWEGEPLGEDEYVLSADEKPGVQARMRIHLPLPPGPGWAMRAESEYHRFGTLACLAAYDVHRAQVMGRCEPTTGIMARLPVHASWLSQVPVNFSVIQRKLLTPDDFDELAAQILAFEKHYNAAARPFDWKFTRTDSTASSHASGSTTGTHRTRWPHEPRRINGRDHWNTRWP